MSNDLHQLLTSITCGALVSQASDLRSPYTSPLHAPPEHPICLDSELTVQEACAALAQHKISSAPIYNAEQGGFVGQIDYRDVVAYVLTIMHKVPHDKQQSFDADMDVKDVVKRALQQGHGSVPVRLLSNMSTNNPLVVVDASAPVLDAVEEFVRAKVHRVVVLDRSVEGKPTFLGVLSQSTVAALVATKLGKLSRHRPSEATWPIGDTSIGDLNLVQGDVISISPDDSVLEGLYQMHEQRISSIAILNKTPDGNDLWGSISMTDIKDVLGRKSGWARLMQPAKKFFIDIRNNQVLENAGHDSVPSFIVHPTTPLVTAVEKMVATHAHRVWVVENDGTGRRVVGVLTLSNVMPLLLK
ncbi:hypothetical protein BC831DRAFT_509644 [Entophlyctis helioformis]|nr:hypothetical protein BC831DRAFT_509644 [Entophlyctis helioformis]